MFDPIAVGVIIIGAVIFEFVVCCVWIVVGVIFMLRGWFVFIMLIDCNDGGFDFDVLLFCIDLEWFLSV